MARRRGNSWSVSIVFGCCCLASICIMTLAQSPSSLSANGSEASTGVANEVLGNLADHGQSTVEEMGRVFQPTSRPSPECSNFTSMFFVDPASNLRHRCKAVCPTTDGTWTWCNNLCPVYYKCLYESRLRQPTMPNGWNRSTWLNSTDGNVTDNDGAGYGSSVEPKTIVVIVAAFVFIIIIVLFVLGWCRRRIKKNTSQDRLADRAESENARPLLDDNSSGKAMGTARSTVKVTKMGSQTSLGTTWKSVAACDTNDAPKKVEPCSAAALPGDGGPRQSVPSGSRHRTTLSLPIRASTMEKLQPAELTDKPVDFVPYSFEDPSEKEAGCPESRQACLEVWPKCSLHMSIAVEETGPDSCGKVPTGDVDEQTHPKVLDTSVAHEDLRLEDDTEGARRPEDLFQGVPKSTLREKLNGISWVQTKNFCSKVLEITVDHVAETEDKEKVATDLAEKLGIPKESIRLLRLLKGTKPTLRLTPSAADLVDVLNDGDAEAFTIGAEVEVEGGPNEEGLYDQYALTVSHPIKKNEGQRCYLMKSDNQPCLLGTAYVTLDDTEEADAALIRIVPSIRLDHFVHSPCGSLQVRPKLYTDNLLEGEIVTKMTPEGLQCMAGTQATNRNCGKVYSTDYEVHGYLGLMLIAVVSIGGSQQAFHKDGESGTLLIKRGHHDGTVEAIGLLFGIQEIQEENGVMHFVSLAFPLTDVMLKLSEKLERTVSFPADMAAMDSGISTLHRSQASDAPPSEVDFVSISVTQD